MPHLCFTVTTGCPHAASGCTTVETCKGLSGKQFESLRRRGVRGLFPCLLRSLSVSPSVSIRLCFCLRLLEPVSICCCRVLLSSSLHLFLPFSPPPFLPSSLSLFPPFSLPRSLLLYPLPPLLDLCCLNPYPFVSNCCACCGGNIAHSSGQVFDLKPDPSQAGSHRLVQRSNQNCVDIYGQCSAQPLKCHEHRAFSCVLSERAPCRCFVLRGLR